MPRRVCRARCKWRWRGRAEQARAFRPVARLAPWRAASRATTTLDLPVAACWACWSSMAANPNLSAAADEPNSTAPVAAVLINSRRLFIAILIFRSVRGRRFRPSCLQFRFHAVRQCKQSLLRAGRGLIGNDAHQVRAFAEDHALRVRNARIAQLNGLGVPGLPVSRILRAPAASPMVCTSTVASNWPWYL